MLSLQTNVASIDAQRAMKQNDLFQSKTIEQLTSGYRINFSGDDSAGLAVANTFRSDIAELRQGVANANDGIGQLQIVDGGLSNITTLLDRMKTLAAQSASGTFGGDRRTLDQEYQQLMAEVTRQADNVSLNYGGDMNRALSVYLGGAPNVASAGVLNIDLSGVQHSVDASSLNLSGTQLTASGVTTGASGNALNAPNATFVKGTPSADNETFSFNLYTAGGTVTQTVTIAASTAGTSADSILQTFNTALNAYGVKADLDDNGKLEFTGSTAFSLTANTGSGTAAIMNSTFQSDNRTNYVMDGKSNYSACNEVMSLSNANGAASVTLSSSDTLASAIAKINAQTASIGIYAVSNSLSTGITLQSVNDFNVNTNWAGVFPTVGAQQTTPALGSATSNSEAAITAINAAVHSIGLVQGVVGAGENKLQYAIGLAQAEISSFSAAESQIRDADVAAQAANLTRAQVMQQTSVAAMAQANQMSQAAVKLLQ